MLNLSDALSMIAGKIRRACLIAFRKKKVEEQLERRRGACSRCGACCKILFKCPAYDDSNGEPKCLIYNDRPGVCGLFPLDEKDLRERDITMPGTKCGYWFTDDKEKQRPSAAPIRWGPPPGAAKVGTFEIAKAFFVKPKKQ